MLSKEQIDSHRGYDVVGDIFGVVFWVALTESIVAIVCFEMPPRRFVSVLGLAFVLSAAFFSAVFAFAARPRNAERHLLNSIGYHLVWTLKEGDPDNRVERRDSPQLSTLNTSEWMLYEPLGGPNRQMYIASRTGKDRDKMAGVLGLRITRIRGDQCHASSTLCVKNTRTGQEDHYSVWNLLRVLNRTDGALGEVALTTLLRDLEVSQSALLKATEEASKNEILRSIQVQETMRLRTERNQIEHLRYVHAKCLKLAMKAINEAADALAKRSVRNKDVIRHLEDQMTRLQNIAASEQVSLPPLA